jgi:hypothetical protein
MGYDERNINEFVVELRVVGKVSVFLKLFPMIASNEETRLLCETCRFKRLVEATDACVDLPNCAVVQRPEGGERVVTDRLPESGADLCIQRPEVAESAIRDLLEVSWGRDVRSVGIHVVNPEEKRSFNCAEERSCPVFDI